VDAQLVINYLNNRPASGEGEGGSGSSGSTDAFSQETVLAGNWAASLFSQPKRVPSERAVSTSSKIDSVIGQLELLDAPQVSWQANHGVDSIWAEIGSEDEADATGTLLDDILEDLV
jgi:hypothetical protein